MKFTNEYYSLNKEGKKEIIRKLYSPVNIDNETLETFIDLRDISFTYLDNIMKLADKYARRFGLTYDEEDFEKIAKQFDTFFARDLENCDLNIIKLNELFELIEREQILNNLCSLFLQKMNEKYHDKLTRDEQSQKHKSYMEAHERIYEFSSMLNGNIESTKAKINSILEEMH